MFPHGAPAGVVFVTGEASVAYGLSSWSAPAFCNPVAVTGGYLQEPQSLGREGQLWRGREEGYWDPPSSLYCLLGRLSPLGDSQVLSKVWRWSMVLPEALCCLGRIP